MNMNSLGYQAYKKTQVQTADQGRLVLMCYDGTINFLRRAQKAHAEKNIVSRNEFLTKAQNVLWELINGLNFQAGEIAYNLESLYNYMIRRILDSQFTDSVEPVNEVITHLQELEESWKTILLKQS